MPRDVARSDQIAAVLREAERPLQSPQLYARLGDPYRSGWGYRETVELCCSLYDAGRLDVAAVACCPHHAWWRLMPDR